MFAAIKCSGCGANVEINESIEFAICEYCGTRIFNEERVALKKAAANSGDTIQNLIKRAEAFEMSGDYLRAQQYFDRVLDIDAGNEEAIAGIRRARGIVDFDNVCVYLHRASSKSTVYVQIDDGETIPLINDKKVMFSCDVGIHKMLFFTILSSECVIEFEITNAFNEKRIAIEKSIFGLYATVTDV